MFFSIESAVRRSVICVIPRWLITPHSASDTIKGTGKPIPINLELALRDQWFLTKRPANLADTSEPCQRPIQTDGQTRTTP